MGFSKDFIWAVSTSAFQIEGAAFEDGKGLSIWDVYSHEKGRIRDEMNADTACDHYHRFREDVELMAELGVGAYRFSVSWPRLIPNGIGEVNPKGIAFYNQLIDALLAHNITPIMTLYHWDYPYELEKRGGWLNPDSPAWFESYVDVVTKAFGDRVKHYITLNEPQCFMAGYTGGAHAPGKKFPLAEQVLMGHNVLLSHGLAVQKIRRNVADSVVGYAPCYHVAIPATDAPEDVEAARKQYFDVNDLVWCASWWSDPVVLGRYPDESEKGRELMKYLPASYREDLKIICQPLDFYGQNIYNGYLYRADGSGGCTPVLPPPDTPITAARWPVTPECMYWGAKFLYERYKLPVFITENGMADTDWVFLDGKVHDPHRIDFLHRYLRAYRRAADEGIPLVGYGLWSLLDNFEWSEGYSSRFGLVYVDYASKQRIPKDSFYWYKEVIAGNGDTL